MSSLFHRMFLAHPASRGETYFQHMSEALCISSRLLIASQFALIHAFIPGVDLFSTVFQTTSSEFIKSVDKTINRTKKL